MDVVSQDLIPFFRNRKPLGSGPIDMSGKESGLDSLQLL